MRPDERRGNPSKQVADNIHGVVHTSAMVRPHRIPFRPVVAACAAGVALTLASWAQAQAPGAGKPLTASAEAVAACERAARQSLPAPAAQAGDVVFSGAPSVQPSLSSESQVVLIGGGRWRGAGGTRSFTYSCNVDPRAPESVGLVLRDSTPTATQAPATIEPDLSRLSPASCESSAVRMLKERWPGVSKISFDSATRSLRQHSATSAELHGSGRALPTPDAPATFFEFDCSIDPRDGRVVRTSVSG